MDEWAAAAFEKYYSKIKSGQQKSKV